MAFTAPDSVDKSAIRNELKSMDAYGISVRMKI